MIDNVMLVGDGLKFVSALIVPVEQGLMKWCADHQISWTNMEDICKHPKVIELYQSIVDKYNPLFGHIEQIKKFKLIPEVWQPIKADGSEGELTPTLKLKRRLLKAKYASLIEGMYAE
jgi:long-chain acyl-CoA synthetase